MGSSIIPIGDIVLEREPNIRSFVLDAFMERFNLSDGGGSSLAGDDVADAPFEERLGVGADAVVFSFGGSTIKFSSLIRENCLWNSVVCGRLFKNLKGNLAGRIVSKFFPSQDKSAMIIEVGANPVVVV